MHPPGSSFDYGLCPIIPVGSTSVPGNRSQKGLRKRQKAEASLQESSCHPVISFDIWMARTNLHGLKLVPSLQRTSLCIAKSYCWRSRGSLVAAEQSLPFPPSWNGTYGILLLSDHHSHHDSLPPIFIQMFLMSLSSWYDIAQTKQRTSHQWLMLVIPSRRLKKGSWAGGQIFIWTGRWKEARGPPGLASHIWVPTVAFHSEGVLT